MPTSLVTQQFIPISAKTLGCCDGLNVDVYLIASADSTPTLFCSREVAVESEQLRQIIKAGVSKLYIDSTSYTDYQTHLRNNWKSILDQDRFNESNRTAVMSEVVRAVLSEQFASTDTQTVVETCSELGGSIVNVIAERPVLVSELSDVMYHDYATFTHSSNVASYMAVIAKALGYSGNELQQIVVAALLHDIGKLEIPDSILAKPGRLDEFEFRHVQLHPGLGFRRLINEQRQLTYDQLMLVYQHHEKLNGKGYPVGLPAEEIHPWAKMCSVVDIFEALTSQRPYRKPMTHATALAMLDSLAGTELDAEMVKCWKMLM
ncbi:MAG: HD domain-containing protein [Pirellulaceae bacterium]|nr:HD domain-containing protein [Pirellulaceae bacterium]